MSKSLPRSVPAGTLWQYALRRQEDLRLQRELRIAMRGEKGYWFTRKGLEWRATDRAEMAKKIETMSGPIAGVVGSILAREGSYLTEAEEALVQTYLALLDLQVKQLESARAFRRLARLIKPGPVQANNLLNLTHDIKKRGRKPILSLSDEDVFAWVTKETSEGLVRSPRQSALNLVRNEMRRTGKRSTGTNVDRLANTVYKRFLSIRKKKSSSN